MTPASSLRKPSYRQSMVPQPPSTTSQSLAPGRGLNGMFRASGISSRESGISVLNPPTSARSSRPSTVSRPSSFGIGAAFGAAGSMYTSTVPSTPSIRDPRPLRDKAYQANMLQKTQKYLVEHNFEIEMKHPLTPKTLKTPTQKDFVMLFQWLFRRMDPGYKFTKSIDHEVYSLLRIISYPYLESINKSQIAAVGGQNWPVFLGMLYWMVELIQTLETYEWNYEQEDRPDEAMLSLILDRYASRAYRAYLGNEHDYSEYKNEVSKEITEFCDSLRSSIDDAHVEISGLEKRLDELGKESEGYEALVRKSEALESDLIKFKAYIDAMESRKAKWVTMLEKLRDELAKSQQELHDVETMREALQNQIEEQGVSPQEIDSMNAERENLAKSLDQVSSRHEEQLRAGKDQELQVQRLYEAMEASLQKYTSLLYRTGLSSSTDIDLSISILPPLTEENLGLKPEALLRNKNLRHHIRSPVTQLRDATGQRFHQLEDECFRLQEENDAVTESLASKREYIESLEAQLHRAKITYDEVYENLNSDAVTASAEIERMECELETIKSGPQQQLLRLDRRAKAVEIEYEDIQNAALASKAAMNREIDRMIHYLIEFKLHVQSSLEDYENLIEQEHQEDYLDNDDSKEE